jgi:hypothetical protein
MLIAEQLDRDADFDESMAARGAPAGVRRISHPTALNPNTAKR